MKCKVGFCGDEAVEYVVDFETEYNSKVKRTRTSCEHLCASHIKEFVRSPDYKNRGFAGIADWVRLVEAEERNSAEASK